MIGIIAAMPEEIREIEQAVTIRDKKTFGQREFHIGTLGSEEVVLVLSRIGKVAAATTATTLLTHFDVRAILLTGIAGGVAETVNIGDVVVGDSFIQHDFDASPSTLFAKYEIPLLGIQKIPGDPSLVERAVRGAEEVIKEFPGAKVHRGLIGSGDQFIASAEKIRELRAALPDLLCVEMEGAAVAQVCYEYQKPFVSIRSISDRADGNAHVDFLKFVSDVAAPISRSLTSAMMKG